MRIRIILCYSLLNIVIFESCNLSDYESVSFECVEGFVSQDRSMPYAVKLKKEREKVERQKKRKEYKERTGREALSAFGMKVNSDKIMTLFVHKFPKFKGNCDSESYSTAKYLKINQSDLFEINPKSEKYDSWNEIEEEIFNYLKTLNLNYTYADIVLTRDGLNKYGNDDYKTLFAYRLNLEELNKFKNYNFWQKNVSEDQRLKDALYTTRKYRQEEFFDFFK